LLEKSLVLAITVATLAVNGLANTAGINGVSTGEVANRYDLPFTPAGYVFAIWGLIYLALGAFTVYQLAGPGAGSIRVVRIRPAYVFTGVANMAWLWFWHHEALLATLVVMLLLLGSLAAIYWQLRAEPPASIREACCVDAPFRLYLGWITVAFLANASVLATTPGVLPVTAAPTPWSLAMIGLTLVIAAAVYLRLRDAIYLAVISWAAVGIALKAGQAPGVSAPAMVVAALAGLGVIGLLIDRREAPGQSTTG
jgi:hypothetical protein